MIDRELVSLIEKQESIYADLQRLLEQQEKALAESDLSALLKVLSEKQDLFDSLQANESEIKKRVEGLDADPDVKAALDRMALKVQHLLEREEKSLGALKELKEDTVRNAGKVRQARRMLDAYTRDNPTDARFIDEDS